MNEAKKGRNCAGRACCRQVKRLARSLVIGPCHGRKKCFGCGVEHLNEQLVLGHRIAAKWGGLFVPYNLVASCKKCEKANGDDELTELKFVKSHWGRDGLPL